MGVLQCMTRNIAVWYSMMITEKWACQPAECCKLTCHAGMHLMLQAISSVEQHGWVNVCAATCSAVHGLERQESIQNTAMLQASTCHGKVHTRGSS